MNNFAETRWCAVKGCEHREFDHGPSDDCCMACYEENPSDDSAIEGGVYHRFVSDDLDARIKASLSNLCKICNNVAEQSGYCFRHELKIEELHNARLYDLRVIGE